MKKINKFLAALLIAVLAISVVPAQAEAASTKKVTAGTSYNNAKAIGLGKNVVTIKSVKDSYSYVKFKAPNTAKYTFVMSDLVDISNKKATFLGNWYLMENKGNYYDSITVSTEGGKTHWLKMASKNFDDKFLKNKNDKLYYRKTRSAKNVKLKKGQTIWMRLFLTTPNKDKAKYTMTVKKVK